MQQASNKVATAFFSELTSCPPYSREPKLTAHAASEKLVDMSLLGLRAKGASSPQRGGTLFGKLKVSPGRFMGV